MSLRFLWIQSERAFILLSVDFVNPLSFLPDFCLLCGALAFPQTSPTCRFCSDLLVERHLAQRSLQCLPSAFGLRLRSLYAWKPGHSTPFDPVGLLIHRLKKNQNLQTWENLAQQLLHHQLGFLQRREEKWLYLALPSSSGGRHSQLLAQALARHTQGKSQSPFLLATSDGEFRQTKRRRRFRRKIHLTEEITKADRWILVDDVVTTGATVRAALIELQKQTIPLPLVEVWSLAHRQTAPLQEYLQSGR